jgi:hypothetical protein
MENWRWKATVAPTVAPRSTRRREHLEWVAASGPQVRSHNSERGAQLAGDNQHFIPQFVQAGFSSRGTAAKRKTWVYRTAQPPFEPNLRNINAERHFYGTATNCELDERITELESGEFVPLWKALCLRPVGTISEVAAVARLVAHFEARTKHLRVMFLNPVNRLLDRMDLVLRDTEAATQRVMAWYHKDPLNFADAELLRRLGPARMKKLMLGFPQRRVEEMARAVVTAAPAKLAFARAMMDLPAQLKAGHNQALLETLGSSSARTSAYEALGFRVVEYADADVSLVLGDSICLFGTSGGECRPIHSSPAELALIMIPLTSKRALIGTHDPNGEVPSADVVRQAAIRCSREQFIAASLDPALSDAAREIGLWADVLSSDDVEEITDSTMRQFLCGDSQTEGRPGKRPRR